MINLYNNGNNINIKLIDENAKIPTKGTQESAGYDLYNNSNEEIQIQPHETVLIKTGIATEIPEGYFGAIFPRSGLSTKRGLGLINSVGVIDSDFRAEILVPLHNFSNKVQSVTPKERIAQLILLKYENINFNVVDNLSDTQRGLGGFGSTGTN